MRLNYFTLLVPALSIVVFGACTQRVDAEGDVGADGDHATSSASLSGVHLTPEPIIYFGPTVWNAYVGTAPCVTIAAPAGTWVAAYTFQGDSAYCSYDWSTRSAVPDTATLLAVLTNERVAPQNVSVDAQGCAGAACVRPVTQPYVADGPGGGGGVSCKSCRTASLAAGGYIDIVIPQEIVTPGPSLLYGLVSGKRATFVQPGGVAAFRVPGRGSSPKPWSVAAIAGCNDSSGVLLPGSSIVNGYGGACDLY